MTIHELISGYEEGSLTALYVAYGVMNLVDEANVDSVLPALPVEVVNIVEEYVVGYESGPKIWIGGDSDPGHVRVESIRRWFERHGSL